MKILIITQAVDSKNTTLGFFVRFIEEFAKRTEKTTVICLEKGDFVLPKNINIFSLGKEQIKSRWNYLKNFFKLIFKIRKDYDTVFVHMNQEYIILGFLFWKIFRKKIFLWRNHPYGNFITRIAVKMSDVVFATSNQAYVSKFDKTKIMPVGVDKRIFKTDDSNREVGSILVFGRIAPANRGTLPRLCNSFELSPTGVCLESNRLKLPPLWYAKERPRRAWGFRFAT
jgi:hypothetical protein